jgi:hypothetical protein
MKRVLNRFLFTVSSLMIRLQNLEYNFCDKLLQYPRLSLVAEKYLLMRRILFFYNRFILL